MRTPPTQLPRQLGSTTTCCHAGQGDDARPKSFVEASKAKTARLLAAVCAPLFMFGCGGIYENYDVAGVDGGSYVSAVDEFRKENEGNFTKTANVPRRAEDLYDMAWDALLNGETEKAARLFQEVEGEFPYLDLASRSHLMAAYALFETRRYDAAITELDRFIQLHPANKDIAYAYYLKALSYYNQIPGVGRDSQLTRLALDSLEEVERRFPKSRYAGDASLKADAARSVMAANHMSIGRFYQEQGHLLAAINRFRLVTKEYRSSKQVAEALHRLVECYLALGIVEEARMIEAALRHTYPGTEWQQDSYALVTRGGLDGAPETLLAENRAAANSRHDETIPAEPPVTTTEGQAITNTREEMAGHQDAIEGDPQIAVVGVPALIDIGPSSNTGMTDMTIPDTGFRSGGYNASSKEIELLQRWSLSDTSVAALSGQGFAPELDLEWAGRRQQSSAASEVTVQLQLFDGRVSAKFNNTEGSDIQKTGRFAMGHRFSTEDGQATSEEWHRKVDFSLEAVRSHAFTMNINGGTIDERLLRKKGQLSLREISGWDENSVKDVGFDLGFLGERIRYSTKYSRSSSRSLSEFSGGDAEADSGSGQWHRIDADLLKTKGVTLSAYGLYNAVDPSYREASGWNDLDQTSFENLQEIENEDLEEGLDSLFSTAGKTKGFGTTIDFGFGELGFSQSDDSYDQGGRRRTREITGSLEYDFASLSLSQEEVASFSNGEKGSRETTYSGEIGLELGDLFSSDGETFELGRFLPTSIRLNAARGFYEDLDVDSNDPDLETTMGLSFYWDWGTAETDLSFSRTVYDSRNVDYWTSDTKDYSVDVGQMFFGDNWDLYGYLSFYQSESESEDSSYADRSLSGMLDFSYFDEDFPDLTLSLGYDRNRSLSSDYGFDFDSRYQSWIVGLSLDFAKFMPIFVPEDKPRLKLTYYREATSNFDSDMGSAKDWGHAIVVSGGFKF